MASFQQKNSSLPKDPDPSKLAILRIRTPAIQVQTPPLEGPRILRAKNKQPKKLSFLTLEIQPENPSIITTKS